MSADIQAESAVLPAASPEPRRPPVRWWLAVLAVPVVVALISLSCVGAKQAPTECTAKLSRDASDASGAVREVLFARLAHYERMSEEAGQLFYFSLLCIGIVLATLLRHRRSVSVQGVEIPTRPLHAAVAVMMTYFWFELVFVLNRLLHERSALASCIQWMERSTPNVPRASMLPLIQNSAFVEAWAQLFDKSPGVVSGGMGSATVAGLSIVGMAAGIGLAHAAVYAVIHERVRGENVQPAVRVFIEAARWVLIALIVIPYVWFQAQQPAQWFSFAAALMFVGWCCALERMAAAGDSASASA